MIAPFTIPLVGASIEASLIICTRNRAGQLRGCLESVDVQRMRSRECELVIVDNGSDDDTKDVLQRFVQKFGESGIRLVEEPRTGKSFALNAGLSEARGRVIAFTDDDCYLDQGYFDVLLNAFHNGDFGYCGGQIRRYDPSDAFYVCNHEERAYRIPPFAFVAAGRIQGANMAFRREVIDQIGGFDTLFGAGRTFRCADIDFVGRAAQAGFAGAHVPDLIVYHHHGRKEGAALEALKRENDYARGAYYAKFILAGRWKYLYRWSRLAVSGGWGRWRREVKGAWDYARIRNRDPDM